MRRPELVQDVVNLARDITHDRFLITKDSKRSLAGSQPITETTIRDWLREAEKVADVPWINGRVACGFRRVAVVEAKRLGISREVLKSRGGWTDSQVSHTFYAEEDALYSAEEAARIRSQIRGEDTSEIPDQTESK